MQEIGIDIFDYELYGFDRYHINEYQPNYFNIDEYGPSMIKLIRRGVIGVHQIGYIY